MMKFARMLTTQLRKVPGGILAGELVRRAFSAEQKNVRVDDFDGTTTMFLDLGEHMQSQIFWYGCYNRDILALLGTVLGPGMVFIDGGANIGEISLAAAKRVGPQGKVIAFEPVHRLADRLRLHTEVNRFGNIDVHEAGLSDRPGAAVMYVPGSRYRDGTQNDGLATLYPTEFKNRVEEVSVPLITLDEFASSALNRVDVIKLDIEGGELAALRGADEVLARFSPSLIVEVSDENCRAAGHSMPEILNFLSCRGYMFAAIVRNGHLRKITSAGLASSQNLYCTKRDR